jgi:hypothetical protein
MTTTQKQGGPVQTAIVERLDLIFISGIMRRSGTNYIARLLLEHRDVCRPDGHWELPLFEAAGVFTQFHEAFLHRGPRGRLAKLRASFKQVKHPDRLNYSIDDFARCFGEGMMGLLVERVPAESRSSRYLLHKNPGTEGIEHFRRFFPDAKLIFLVRDGRDNVNSLMVAAGFKGRRWGIKRRIIFCRFAREWARSAQRVMSYSTRPESNCIVVKYEELNSDPERVLKRISEYLDLPVYAEWLRQGSEITVTGSGFYRASGDTIAESAGETNWKAVNRTDQFKPVGRWRASWSWLDKFLFAKIAGRALKELGYQN